MLNLEDNYNNDEHDFEEINKTLEQLNPSVMMAPKNEAPNEEKLPFYTKLIMFLCGFSYCGLTIIATIVTLVFKDTFKTDAALDAAVQTGTYLALFFIFVGIAVPYRKYFIANLKDGTKYLKGITFGVMTIGVEMIISYIIMTLFPSETNANQEAVESLVTNYPTLMFFITVIIGPICEEMTYRVGLYEMIREKNETVALIVTAFVFAFIHIQFTETTFAAEATSFPIYLAIGVMLTYAYKKNGLPGSFIAHAMLNGISFLGILAQQHMGV